uniref:Uncharacterized protein n=1 Tax=Glossina austeni TaxID=7395 RepID=A0A1A9UFA5_GLOAU
MSKGVKLGLIDRFALFQKQEQQQNFHLTLQCFMNQAKPIPADLCSTYYLLEFEVFMHFRTTISVQRIIFEQNELVGKELLNRKVYFKNAVKLNTTNEMTNIVNISSFPPATCPVAGTCSLAPKRL